MKKLTYCDFLEKVEQTINKTFECTWRNCFPMGYKKSYLCIRKDVFSEYIHIVVDDRVIRARVLQDYVHDEYDSITTTSLRELDKFLKTLKQK